MTIGSLLDQKERDGKKGRGEKAQGFKKNIHLRYPSLTDRDVQSKITLNLEAGKLGS
jgi:hypothetical protein